MADTRLIGERGVAFIRRTVGSPLEAMCDEVQEMIPHGSNILLRSPSNKLDRPALGLVSSREVKNRRALALVPALQAVRHVVETVPGLLDPYNNPPEVFFDDVQVTTNASRVQFVKLFARQDRRPVQERLSILGALAELTPDAITWRSETPSMTLLSADDDVPRSVFDSLEAGIRELLPVPAYLDVVRTSPNLPAAGS